MNITMTTNTASATGTNLPGETIGTVGAAPALIKKKELAKRISVSPRTIDNWAAKRMIPFLQVSPRFYLYDFEAVLAALRKHYQVDTLS